MLKIAIIGGGRIVQRAHLPLLTRLAQVQIIGVAELDATVRQTLHSAYPQLRLVADYAELLPSADAVLVALPPTEYQPILAAFAAGKHVYVEKPMTNTVTAADQIVQAWQQAGTVGMVGYNFRFNPLAQQTAALLQQGALGQIRLICTTFSTTPPYGAWKLRRSSGGGVLWDLIAHDLDLLRYWLKGEFSLLATHLHSYHSEEDNAALLWQTADNVPMQMWAGLHAPFQHRIEFIGAHGQLELDFAISTQVRVRHNSRFQRLLDLLPAPYIGQKLRAVGQEPSYAPAWAAFLQAIAQGTPYGHEFATPADALAVIRQVAYAQDKATR
jgi:predicted dehydrogenase